MPACRVYYLGTIEYQKARNLQNQLAAQIAGGEHPPTLLLLEHPHVYTFGRSGQAENLLWDDEERKRRSVDIHRVDRRGSVAYHGPGQLVGYPLLKLAEGELQIDVESGEARLPKKDYTEYRRKLEKAIVQTLARFGIVSGQVKGQTGVWIQPDVISRCVNCPPNLKQAPAKIASIGVKVDANGILRHGFTLNVNPDMSYWEGIVAGGPENQSRASLEYFLDPLPSMDEVAEAFIEAFGNVFGCEIERAGKGRLLL